ncbi:MAG TPA: hypothetical protein ACFYD3_10260, partial [Candidatus Hypogeohydataceae bacterium YC41]
GHWATKIPSSSCSIIMRYFMMSSAKSDTALRSVKSPCPKIKKDEIPQLLIILELKNLKENYKKEYHQAHC